MTDANDILNMLNIHYGLDFSSIEFHRDGGSMSYIVGANSNRYFLRVIRPELMDTAVQSIGIHLYLESNHFPVPAIIRTKDNAPYIQKSHKNGDHLYLLYEFIEGDEPSFEDAENAGDLVGRFHSLMKRYPNDLKVQDKHFFIDRYIEILAGKRHALTNMYKQLGDKLWEKVKDLPRGYCHCDLYRGNIHKSKDGTLYILDFDTSCNAFPMYDVTLFCNETDYFIYSDTGFEKSKALLQRFLKGYLTHCMLTNDEIEAFYYFHAIYHFQLQATIVEIYGVDCNDKEFEDEQLDWIISWLEKAGDEIDHDILKTPEPSI